MEGARKHSLAKMERYCISLSLSDIASPSLPHFFCVCEECTRTCACMYVPVYACMCVPVHMCGLVRCKASDFAVCLELCFFFLFFVVLEILSRTQHMLGGHSTIELYLESFLDLLFAWRQSLINLPRLVLNTLCSPDS